MHCAQCSVQNTDLGKMLYQEQGIFLLLLGGGRGVGVGGMGCPI